MKVIDFQKTRNLRSLEIISTFRICDSCILFSAVPLLKSVGKIFHQLWPSFPLCRMGITTWTKPCHWSVLWSRSLKVLSSLGYKMLGKDNVLLLHPRLKVKVPEISPCLTAWMRFTLSDLFFPLENGLLLVRFKLGSSRIIPEVPPTHLREDMRDLPRGSEACRFLLKSDCQGYVCSQRQWAMDDSSAWRAKNMAWLIHMVTLTLSPRPKSWGSFAMLPHGDSWWHLLSLRSCLSKSRRTVRAKPILWVSQQWCGQPQTSLVHVLQS